jgi:hypothetical protein
MIKTVKTLQVIYFALGIISMIIIIYLNYKRLHKENQESNGNGQ